MIATKKSKTDIWTVISTAILPKNKIYNMNARLLPESQLKEVENVTESSYTEGISILLDFYHSLGSLYAKYNVL